jgi:two-component system, sensor histidine kinase PdtaS
MIGSCIAQEISRPEADSLLLSLRKSKPGIDRINLLLRIAEFHIFKPAEYKADLDSAADFIKQANDLNNDMKSGSFHGYQTLVESYLAKERGQGQAGKELAEKAIQLLSKEKDQLHLAQACLGLSWYYDVNDSLQALEKQRLLERAVLLFQKSDAIKQMANTLELLADVYESQGDASRALVNLNLSLDAYKSIHYTSLQSIYIKFGDMHNRTANHQQALTYYFLALKTAETLHDTTAQICMVYNRIGTIYITMGEWEKAIQYLKSGLEVAEHLNSNSHVLTVVFNAISAYNKLDPARGLAFLNGIPKKYLVTNERGLDFVIPMIYLSIYISLNQYQEGKPYSDQLVTMIDRYKSDRATLYNFYKILANYYIGAKQYASARTYLDKNYELLKMMNDPYRMSLNYRLLFKVDSAEGNYKGAMENLLVYNKLHDSIFNETKSRQIKEIGVKYETEKKEQELKLKENEIRLKKQDILLLTGQYEIEKNDFEQSRLRFEFDSTSKEQSLKLLNSEAARKDNELTLRQKNISLLQNESAFQQEKIKKTKMTRNFIIAAAAMLLLLLGLGYNRYRIKQKANKQINDKNLTLRKLVNEKEWLLKEVHHRVKNNLHTVICLLESQAAYLENDALKANQISQHRIYAMSLIHQKLYQSEDIKTIDMAVYLPEFIRYLDESFGVHYRVSFQLDIEPLKLGVSQAIPISLIINEAVTNSIKYAFPQNRQGIIEITMYEIADQIILTIADDGIGIDPDLAKTPSDSLGLKLIKGLAEDINARISFENVDGTKISIVFNVDPLNDNNNILNTINEKEVYV